MTEPTSTYHVHASFVVHQMISMEAADTIIPAVTPVAFARVVSTPSTNAPSIGPYTIDATVRPAVKTEPHPRATTAMRISTIPHAAVHQRDNVSSCRSGTFPASGWQKSITVVDASELSDSLRLDIAAAKIAAITSPETP